MWRAYSTLQMKYFFVKIQPHCEYITFTHLSHLSTWNLGCPQIILGSVFNKILFSLVIDDLMSKETSRICPKNYGYNKAVFFSGSESEKKVVFHTHVNQNKTQTSSFETSHFVLCKTIMDIAYYIPIRYSNDLSIIRYSKIRQSTIQYAGLLGRWYK